MNNMNFRLQAGCQNCGNCNCRSQNQSMTPGCNGRSQNQNNMTPGCNSCSQNQNNMAPGCNNRSQNQNNMAPGYNNRSQNQNNMAPGCNSRSQSQNNMAPGCNNRSQNQPQTRDFCCDRPHHRPPENCNEAISHIDMHNIPLGIGYVPWQKWRDVYALCEGLSQGTIFKELDYPFYGCIPNGFCSQKGGAR